MLALIWRDLLAISRTGPPWVVATLYVSALALFVVIWGDGLPIAGGGSNWQQFTAFQAALLTVLLPWGAARCSTTSPPEVTRLAILTATRPSRVVLARCLALGTALLLLPLFSAPVVMVMRQASFESVPSVAGSVLHPAGMALFVAAVTTAAMLFCTGRLRGWAVATSATVVAAALVPRSASQGPVWLMLTALVCVSMTIAVDARLTYLEGDVP